MLKCNLKPDWDYLVGDDMEQLGNLFEVAAREYDMSVFVPTFMNSRFREAMDEWHPQYSNGPVLWLLSKVLIDFPDLPKMENNYPHYCMKWIGMTYAYLCFYLNMTSKEIYALLPLDKMLSNYTVGHERSFESFAERFISDYNKALSNIKE